MLPVVFVFGGLLVLRFASPPFEALAASPMAAAQGNLCRALLAGALSRAEVEVHANWTSC